MYGIDYSTVMVLQYNCNHIRTIKFCMTQKRGVVRGVDKALEMVEVQKI